MATALVEQSSVIKDYFKMHWYSDQLIKDITCGICDTEILWIIVLET